MSSLKTFIAFCLFTGFAGTALCAGVILNEYNAVDTGGYLGGGTFAADDSGGRASDSYFGRVAGNGGDWFELVVITDHLDMRNWKLIVINNGSSEILNLTNHSIWSDLRSGTIITVAEDVPSDISYNPAAGDWWINVQAHNDADGLYIEATSFPVSSSDWQLEIRNVTDAVIFGPAGEGISPASGIGGDEVFKLKETPDAATPANSTDYDGDKKLSTFGAPNQWGQQNLDSLHTVALAPSSLILVSPNGSEVIKGGQILPITWNYTGMVDNVLIEYSFDNGNTWLQITPPNTANSGLYLWTVPILNSEACLIRITNANNPGIFDTSNAAFTVYECNVQGDVTGDCITDLNDLAIIAAFWLDCGNPYDLNCAP